MRYLLDTHIFIWWILDHPKLPKSVPRHYRPFSYRAFLQLCSAWKIVIKANLGKLSLPENPVNGYESILTSTESMHFQLL